MEQDEQRPSVALKDTIIHPSEEQVRLYNRMDSVLGRRKRFDTNLNAGRYITYNPGAPGLLSESFVCADVKRGFERALVGLKLAMIDQGLSDDSEYTPLLKGNLGEPPKFETPGICDEGHQMLRRGNLDKGSGHWQCPQDNQFRWDREI